MTARALLIVLLLILSPAAARALSCGSSSSLLRHAQHAPLVIVATVVGVEVKKGEFTGPEFLRHHPAFQPEFDQLLVRVERVLKGRPPGEVLWIEQFLGEFGPPPTEFAVGRTWVFALSDRPPFSLAGCGTSWARFESDTLIGELTRCDETSVRAEPDGGVLATNEPERMSVAAFEAAMRTGVSLLCVPAHDEDSTSSGSEERELTGVVLDASGRPAARRGVIAYGADRRLEGARTEADGRFVLTRRPPGALHVFLDESPRSRLVVPQQATHVRIHERTGP